MKLLESVKGADYLRMFRTVTRTAVHSRTTGDRRTGRNIASFDLLGFPGGVARRVALVHPEVGQDVVARREGAAPEAGRRRLLGAALDRAVVGPLVHRDEGEGVVEDGQVLQPEEVVWHVVEVHQKTRAEEEGGRCVWCWWWGGSVTKAERERERESADHGTRTREATSH